MHKNIVTNNVMVAVICVLGVRRVVIREGFLEEVKARDISKDNIKKDVMY